MSETCSACGEEYNYAGAVLVGPPDVKAGRSPALHLCNACYERLLELITAKDDFR